MGESKYTYIVKEDGEVIATFVDISDVLLYIRACDETYYDEENFNFAIERRINSAQSEANI